MRRLWIMSVLALGVGIGCVAATVAQNFIVPPVRAGTDPVRWEYTCFKGYVWGSGPLDPDDVLEKANPLGQQGWEMVSGDGAGAYCFKRPLP